MGFAHLTLLVKGGIKRFATKSFIIHVFSHDTQPNLEGKLLQCWLKASVRVSMCLSVRILTYLQVLEKGLSFVLFDPPSVLLKE